MAPRLSPFTRTFDVIIPRQLAPTVGLSHDGVEFLKGCSEGLKGYVIGRMTKSRRQRMGPRGRLSRVRVPGPLQRNTRLHWQDRRTGSEPDICTDIIETAQRAWPAQVQPAMKRAFVGFIHGEEIEDGSVSGGETAIYFDGGSSIGKTNSLYQLLDGRLGGCSNVDSIPDPCEPPNRVAVFMACTQPVLSSSTAAAMTAVRA